MVELVPNDIKVDEEDGYVDPWTVRGKIDYTKLIKQFGTDPITDDLIDKFKRVTGKELHPWLKRGIFFSHRELDKFLSAYENGNPVFLYTGRGPTSDAMHIGHLIPFLFTKWLQDVFDCPLVIQISDDEKYAFKNVKFQDVYRMGFENAKDIIACGFNPKKTFIFSNRDYRLQCKAYEIFVSDMKVLASEKEVRKIFGFTEESTIGMYDWPFYQSAASFSQAFPHIFGSRPAYCLIPCAIDQDPYFRLGRDLAGKMGLLKTCTIYCSFIPPLTGNLGKMSSSTGIEATLFLNDTEDIIQQKIMSYAFSGGGGNGTLEEHRKYGGNTDVDISYQYLRYFEEDDDKLNEIKVKFSSGEMSCGEIKSLIISKLVPIFRSVKENREKVSKEDLDEFYSIKPIELPIVKPRERTKAEEIVYAKLDELKIEFTTKYHEVPKTEDDFKELRNSVEGVLCKHLLLKGSKETYYLYIINYNTIVDMKTLHKKMNISKISFAKADTLPVILKVNKGECSLFSLLNDEDKKITNVVIDESIAKNGKVNFQPNRADATTTIDYSDMLKFLDYLGYKTIFVKELIN